MRLQTLNRYRCAGALVAGLLTASMATGAMAWNWPWAHPKKTKAASTNGESVAPAAPMAAQPGPSVQEPVDTTAAPSAATAPAGTGAGQDDSQASSPEATARTQEIYAKNVDRVKRIKSMFEKLRQQVEAVQQADQPLPGGGTYDLPAEALKVDGESTLDTSDPSDGEQGDDQAPIARRGARHAHAAVPTGGEGVHVVQKGDTLSKIAKKYFGSPKKAAIIAAANNITVQTPLKLGQELVIPDGGAPIADTATVGAEVVGSAEPRTKHKTRKVRKPKNPQSQPVLDYSNYEFKMYLIKAGDSLTRIAKQFYPDGGGTDLIKKYNNLGGENIVLRPGAKLLIPLPKKTAGEDRLEQAKKGAF